MNVALRFTDQVALIAAIVPASVAPGAVSTAWLSAADFSTFAAVINAGALGGGTVDAKIEQATDSSGTGAKDVTGAAIAQITADGSQAFINMKGEDLDLENDFSHFRLTVTIAGAAGLVSAEVLAADGRYEPASDFNAASVAEIA